MIELILLFICFLLVFGLAYNSQPKSEDIRVCTKCNEKFNLVELINNNCPMCGGDVVPEHLYKYRQEINDFDYEFQKPSIRHKVGCGCRLCYKTPQNFRDLKEYNWWDFHDGSGQREYASGTLPLFGLWTNKNNLRAPHCLKAKFDWRFNSPCTDPHTGKSPALPFPAECDDLGRCRIRNVNEDHIKNL